jgi:hypothetical protein
VEALPLIQQFVQYAPRDPLAARLLLETESAAAYEQHDYARMLTKVLECQKLAPQDPMVELAVASACSCLFAETSNDDFRRDALEHIDASRKLGQPNDELLAYEDRIRYRLASRKIIDKREFDRQFPHGWKGQAQAP